MFTLITWEHENSEPVSVTYDWLAQCYNIAKNGCFYKAQVVNEFGVVEYEFH